MSETNGTEKTEGAAKAKLDAIRVAHATGKVKVDKKIAGEALKSLKAAYAARDAARAKMDEADAGVFAACETLMNATGAVTLEVPGLGKLKPSGRGDKLFYKRDNEGEVMQLG